MVGCQTPQQSDGGGPTGSTTTLALNARSDPSGSVPSPEPSASPEGSQETEPSSPAVAPPAPSKAAPTTPEETLSDCPDDMHWIEGGEFWIGPSGRRGGPKDERPRFKTHMHPFCIDRTEVTAAAYQSCVEAGACSSATRKPTNCNAERPGRQAHPINCVSWNQADAFCGSLGRRLPTEAEWEFAAKGGAEERQFSWGNESPDGRTCWKQPHSCEVGQFAEGAFGLHDMNGNVWEWTDSYYGAYPWPPKWSHHRVYRGGSWSRRFEKWLSLTLRNRWGPEKFGSHLGFRCAALPEDMTWCPYGQTQDEQGRARCRHGIVEVQCPRGSSWNGVRCLGNGLTSDRADGCPHGTQAEAGFGCVSSGSDQRLAAAAPASPSNATPSNATKGVRVTRSPSFDADCRRHQAKRPKAYRLEGGSHSGRNAVGRRRGCKNRDVGVGWNSACCP